MLIGVMLAGRVTALILVTTVVENGRTYYLDFKGTSLNSLVKAGEIFPCLSFFSRSFSKIYRNGSFVGSLKPLGF